MINDRYGREADESPSNKSHKKGEDKLKHEDVNILVTRSAKLKGRGGGSTNVALFGSAQKEAHNTRDSREYLGSAI